MSPATLAAAGAAEPAGPDDVLDKEFLFVIGSDRSGTTWLQSMIGAHPRVATTVQLTLFHTYVPAWLQSWREEVSYINDPHQWDMGLPVVWSEAELHAFLRGFLRRVYSRVLDKNPSATHILDKHPAYREHVAEINLLLPHAKFIHVLRDGRDVALSLMAAKDDLGWGFGSLAEAAANWARFVAAGRRAAAFGDRYLEVRYEDLHTDGVGCMKRVFEFCDLPATEDEVARIAEAHSFQRMKAEQVAPDPGRKAPPAHYRKGVAGGWREVFTPADRYTFEVHAGTVLRELGYAGPGWWYTSRLQRRAILMRHAIRTLRGRLGRALTALRGA